MDMTEEKLVAYIDGELEADEREALADALSRDADAQARLELLKSGGRPFAEAFDTLLAAAPDEKLQAMFAGLVAQTQDGRSEAPKPGDGNVVPLRPKQPSTGTPLWRMAAAAAILAFVFSGGLITGGLFNQPQQVAEQQAGWREAAAQYVALFSRETLQGMPADESQRRENLARVETALGLDLPDRRIADPELSFEGTQLLQLEGRPLAQISYLDGQQKPVVLCIIRTEMPAAGPASEIRQGLNVVHWVADGYGYMVIGDVPDSELKQIADRFRTQFS
jgi:anti-sigma factor RsiW